MNIGWFGSRERESPVVVALKIMLMGIGLALAYTIRDVLILLLVVALLSAALEWLVERLMRAGVRRILSVIAIYTAFLGAIAGFISLVLPPLVVQGKDFVTNLPGYLERIGQIDMGQAEPQIQAALGKLSEQIVPVAGNLVRALSVLCGGIFSAITAFVLTFYLLLEERSVSRVVAGCVPSGERARISRIMDRVQQKLGHWLTGQLFLMVLIGLIDWLVLRLLNIKAAAALGALGGILEAVPALGPFIAGAAAVFVVLATAEPLWKVIAVVAAYVVIQQLENQVLLPRIMQRAIGLSPAAVIVAILIGAKLLGVGGAFLAVPVAAGIQAFLEEYSGTR